MALLILFVLIGIPAVEIYVFAEVGGIIGGWATVGLTLLTAALGALLFRSQGTAVLQRAQEQLRREETPLAEIIDGIGLLLAALFLFLPGFVTDVAGFLLFIPPLRVVLIGMLFRGAARAADSHVWIVRSRSDKASGASGPGTIIDADFKDLTDNDKESGADSDSNDRKLPPR
ncbi:FxsA family protein [Nisaea sp.]|uniref:FxsA family protein n=1 Tax=Nisaea sp. TaxID=2024842 RepID=UPI0032EB7D0F